MTLGEQCAMLRSMPAGYAQTYLEKKLEELCMLAKLEGYTLTVEEKFLKPLATGNTVMVGHVRRARGHY
jgi:hypothetical protein